MFGTVDDPTAKVFSIMTDTLGEPPGFILRSWNERLSGKGLRVSARPSSLLAERVLELRFGNEERWMKSRMDEFSDEDTTLLADLLTLIFKYDPAERISMESILRHPAMALFKGAD